MSVTVPTAEIRVVARSQEHRPWPVLAVAVGVILAWPIVATISAGEPVRRPPAVSVVRPPTATSGAWVAAVVEGADTRVTGLGETIVAVHSDGIWPVRILRDGEWRQLLGMPLGVSVAQGVGTAVDDGFVVAGVETDRTVLFRYDASGRFQGATTVFGIEAGLVSHAAGKTILFDSVRPEAIVVGEAAVTLPGTVVDGAAGGNGFTVLTADGVVHHTHELGAKWTALGSGYVALVGTGPVYAVGSSASIGLARIMDDGTLDRLAGAPVGPTVTWGDTPAVYDWSSESAWTLSETGWDRVPLWGNHGFVGDFVAMIDGTSAPSVLGMTQRGLAVWQLGE